MSPRCATTSFHEKGSSGLVVRSIPGRAGEAARWGAWQTLLISGPQERWTAGAGSRKLEGGSLSDCAVEGHAKALHGA